MMYKNWPLSKFFLLAFFLFAALATFVVYGWRTNAPGNIWDEDGTDISSPYYDKSEVKHGDEPVIEDAHTGPKAGEPDKEKDDHGHGGH